MGAHGLVQEEARHRVYHLGYGLAVDEATLQVLGQADAGSQRTQPPSWVVLAS